MVGLLVPAALAVTLALLLGGSLGAWSHVRVRWWLVAIGALAVQLALFNPPIDRQPWAIEWGAWLSLAARGALLAVVLRNLAGVAAPMRLAWLLAALGMAMNVLAITANAGYMPQSSQARVAARGATLAPARENGPQLRNVKPIDAETRLVWLGDVIPQPAWVPRANVVSLGDLVLSVGFAFWAFQTTLSVRRRPLARARVAEI